jgi:hypothetical protein
MPVKIKLNAFPTRSFPGKVDRLGVAATMQNEERVFLAQVGLEASDVPLRPGMSGQAKITTGRASLARVIFRRPARWLWGVIWEWLP